MTQEKSRAKQARVIICMLAATLIIYAQVYLDLKAPDYISDLMREVNSASRSMGNVWLYALQMLGCVLVSMGLGIACTFCVGWMATSYAMGLRGKVFGKVMGFSPQDFGLFSTNSLVTRTTNDITQIHTLIASGFAPIVRLPIITTYTVKKLRTLETSGWIGTMSLAVAILLTVVLLVITIVSPKFSRIQAMVDRINGISRENITGIRVIHAYNAEGYQKDKLDEAALRISRLELFTGRMIGIVPQFIALVMSIVTVAIYWVAKLAIRDNPSQVMTIMSDMMVVNLYSIQLILAFITLSFVFMVLPKAVVSYRRVREVLRTPNTIAGCDGGVRGDGCADGEEHSQDDSPAGDSSVIEDSVNVLEFKNVSFRYPGASGPVLTDVNLSIRRGTTVAFIGATGSGKTSIVSLIPRLYDVESGEVLVWGRDVRCYGLDYLRSRIAFVTQKAVLFSGTIFDNVVYGCGVRQSDVDLDEVIKAAQVREFVTDLGTRVAQGGTNFSGGQKQRISIARALARKDADIYIFDDSFSALDTKTDAKVRGSLREILPPRSTKIIVTQRVSTILDADNIFVVDKGTVVSSGSHSDLVARCDFYGDICRSQGV